MVLEDQGAGDCFGAALAPAGDVNGDGYGDLIVGNSDRYWCEGDVMVFLGSADGLEPEGIPLGASLSGASFLGSDVDGAGDLDGDGYDDLIVGSGGPGAYLFRGGPDGPEPELWIALEETSWTRFGRAVAGAGDVNGDGWPDVVVGGGEERDEPVMLYPGTPDGPQEDEGVAATTAYELGLAGVGDVNGDGFDDLLTGSTDQDVLLLGDAALSFDGQALRPEWKVHEYRFPPVHTGGGDVNGDGWPDLASSRPGSGISIWLGSSEGFDRNPDLVLLEGEHRGLAEALAMGGDMDGDGDDELAAVAYWDRDEDGEVVLYTGHESGPGGGTVIRWPIDDASPYGLSVAFTGDSDGDGYDELAIGYPGEQRVYLFPGGVDDDGDGYAFPGDCLDSDPTVHPGGIEVCNGLDDDCDGETDDADAEGATDWYADSDGDGYPAHDQREVACDAPAGYLAGGPPWDCDNWDARIHPGAEEIPNDDIDQDCDGEDLRTDTGEAPPVDDEDGGEQEGGRCSHTTTGAMGVALLSALALALARRRRPLLLIILLATGCDGQREDSDAPADTGWRDLAGAPLTTLLAGEGGETILAGEQGRVIRWSEAEGFEELPPAGRWRHDADVQELYAVEGSLWALHGDGVSRWLGEDWVDSGLEPGEISWGEAVIPGLAFAAEDLWAFTELPPDNDPDCIVGCSETHQIYLHRWDGMGWVRVHHLQLEGASGHAAAAGDELLLSHGGLLKRWDEGALSSIDHPLTGTLVQTTGLGEGQLVTRNLMGLAAVGDLTGLSLIDRPEGAAFDFITGTASDDLYALAGDALYHHDGAAWSQVPMDTEAARSLAVGTGGSLHVLAYDGANSLHRGDRNGVVEVWREDATSDDTDQP